MEEKEGRGQGGKLRNGVTKSEILIFLSSGKKSRQDILDNLDSKFEIARERTVDIHLAKLCKDDFITKNIDARGKSISFFIKEDFEHFMKIIKFLDENGRSNQFAKSDYVFKTINEDFLREYSKELIIFETAESDTWISLTKEERLMDPNYVRRFGNPKSEYSKELVKEMDRIQDDPEFRKLVAQMLSSPKYHDKPKLMREIATGEFESNFGTNAKFPSLFECHHMVNFPLHERDEIIQILRSSPTSLNYLINILHDPERKPRLVLYGYMLPELIGAARISKRYEEENEQNRLRIDEWVKGIFSSILQNRKEPSMLLQVLRGSLILDITKGNVVVTEYEKEFFERLISNRSTQLDNKIEEMRL